jgi:hypothetical protein
MGIFDDKKFDQLDWLSQITETIESDLNNILAKLPDKVTFSINDILSNTAPRFRDELYLKKSSVVYDMLESRGFYISLTYHEKDKLVDCFEYEVSPNLEINLATLRMTGSIALIKKIPTLPDEDLMTLMGARGIDIISSLEFADSASKAVLARANEMLDILGQCEKDQKSSSFRKKRTRLCGRLREILTSNEWRIRDMNLADKVGLWIAEYIQTGNLAALTNLCKLKVMTHRNMPIYSMEEEK